MSDMVFSNPLPGIRSAAVKPAIGAALGWRDGDRDVV
jgi:hypothetical protein